MSDSGIRSQEWVDKIEELVRKAESLPDANAREITVDLLRAVLDFHSAAIERMLQIVQEAGTPSEQIIKQIATDDVTSSMLLLHDLHPDDLETRVDRAVRKLEEVFFSLGVKLSLVSLESNTVHLHFGAQRSWTGAPVKTSIEKAIFQAAPEITTVVIEGLKESPPADFVPISDLLAGSRV